MRRFTTVIGGFAAAILLPGGAALAQQIHDPMAALITAPAYDALHPAGGAPAAEPIASATAAQPVSEATTSDAGPDPELGGLPQGAGSRIPIIDALLATLPRSSSSSV